MEFVQFACGKSGVNSENGNLLIELCYSPPVNPTFSTNATSFTRMHLRHSCLNRNLIADVLLRLIGRLKCQRVLNLQRRSIIKGLLLHIFGPLISGVLCFVPLDESRLTIDL